MTTIVSTKLQLSFDKDFDDITMEDIKQSLMDVSLFDVKRALFDACDEDIQVS